MNKKWLSPILPYIAVWAGLFLLKSAWLSLIGFHAAILLTLIIARPNIPIDILFQSKYPKLVLASVLLCLTSGIVLYYLWNVLGIAGDLSTQLQSIGLTSTSWIAFIVYFSLVNPFVEEYFWRAYLGSDKRGFYIGDLIFAGYHALILINKANPLAIIFALVCLTFIGWFWRQTHREDNGLLAPVLGHMAADFTILVCVMYYAGTG